MNYAVKELAAPKSNRVLFPPRIAQRYTDGGAFKRTAGYHANDNITAAMTGVEVQGGVVMTLDAQDALDLISGDWQPGRSVRTLGPLVRILDDGPQSNPPTDAANDNQPTVTWPLGKALKADGEPWLLRAAAIFKSIDDLANGTDTLRGTGQSDGVYRLDQKTWVRADGEIVYKGVRQITSGDPAPGAPTQVADG